MPACECMTFHMERTLAREMGTALTILSHSMKEKLL